MRKFGKIKIRLQVFATIIRNNKNKIISSK